MNDSVILYEYIIHEGVIDGSPFCGLLWLGTSWLYTDAPCVGAATVAGGFVDVSIESGDSVVLLKAVDKKLAALIAADGLLVIYKDSYGVARHCFVPPRASQVTGNGH